jgi:hypothetical protein
VEAEAEVVILRGEEVAAEGTGPGALAEQLRSWTTEHCLGMNVAIPQARAWLGSLLCYHLDVAISESDFVDPLGDKTGRLLTNYW